RPSCFILYIFLIICCANRVQAQQVLGVNWNIPEDDARAIEELKTLNDLGFNILQIHEVPSQSLWKAITQQNFKVWGRLNIQFPTTHTFSHPDSSFTSDIENKLSIFSKSASVQAINLIQFGRTDSKTFRATASTFFDKLYSANGAKKRITTVNQLPSGQAYAAGAYLFAVHVDASNSKKPDIPEATSIHAYKYFPATNIQSLVTPFHSVVKQLADSIDKPLIVESDWLFSMVQNHPRFKESLQSLTSKSATVFPLPHEEIPSPNPSPLPALILLIVWGSLAFHYHMSPLYRKSLFRYITSHIFFLEDVYHQQIRSPIPSAIIIIQHALMISAVLFCLSSSLWSSLGLESLRLHYPEFFIIGNAKYNIFILTLSVALILPAISIAWLSFFHKSFRSMAKMMTLYAWPLQFNFALGTLAIVIYLAGGPSYLVVLLAKVMILLFAGSFIIASLDGAHIMSTDQPRYLGLTTGIYTVLLLVALSFFFWLNDPFWQTIALSQQL